MSVPNDLRLQPSLFTSIVASITSLATTRIKRVSYRSKADVTPSPRNSESRRAACKKPQVAQLLSHFILRDRVRTLVLTLQARHGVVVCTDRCLLNGVEGYLSETRLLKLDNGPSASHGLGERVTPPPPGSPSRPTTCEDAALAGDPLGITRLAGGGCPPGESGSVNTPPVRRRWDGPAGSFCPPPTGGVSCSSVCSNRS